LRLASGCITDVPSFSTFSFKVFAHVEHYEPHALVTATVAFYGQIYFDFAGYSSMAIGTARLFGYRFPPNFNYPYRAASVTEFWRRWHMSLSFWLRDYVYIPIGGNRGGTLFVCRNLMITMLLGGLWHGAAWNYVVWGALHGVALFFARPDTICLGVR
jgi:alginate O-acetyltransferase complex protein AlgI